MTDGRACTMSTDSVGVHRVTSKTDKYQAPSATSSAVRSNFRIVLTHVGSLFENSRKTRKINEWQI